MSRRKYLLLLTYTRNQIVEKLQQVMNKSLSARSLSKWMLRGMGWFYIDMREMVELYYLYNHRFVLDTKKYEKYIGSLPVTELEEGLRETVNAKQQGM
ncbi:hypothetical protein [Melghirimyces algeriensis]|uniref:Uncharacterized protein n=1 Tax=Melghirimyces algeriensis TaxID=910412 RepID=A0A521E2W9_9BACL|nr:hypothetical protein [Melghirimyces algeriensis]SMO77681.1 hypothetical protein SAMN06264849_107112 [Melghirimyces algeriensis]